MLKNLLTACAIVITLAPQAYAAPNWENVGKTSTGETLSLDTNSVQNKTNAGGWLFFSYGLKGSVETRQSIAKTASCSGGKLSSSKPGWIVDSTSRQVYADSVGSQNLLQRVCQLGKIASYSESNYGETDESDKALNSYSNVSTRSSYSDNEINYLASIDRLLIKTGNPVLRSFSDAEKINTGNVYCQLRRAGGSPVGAIQFITDSNPTLKDSEVFSDYLTTTAVVANIYLCPQ